MIIIGFSDKTSKILPRIFCRRWRHCAPIVIKDGDLTMLQFVRIGTIEYIKLKMRDIEILRAYGWRFVYVSCALPRDFNCRGVWSCVQLCRRAIGMRGRWILTPNALYKKIRG